MMIFHNLKLLVSGIICLSLVSDAFSQSINKHIKTDQFGYLPDAEKIAIIAQPVQGYDAPSSYVPSEVLRLRSTEDHQTVFSGSTTSWKSGETHVQSGDRVWYFDFSDVQSPGQYYVFDSAKSFRSHSFYIHQDIYSHVLKEATRSFYYQRCGVAKVEPFADPKWTDAACHIHGGQDTECYLVTDKGNAATKKDLSGGWHDAGDYNKYTSFTYNTLHEMLFAYQENPAIFTDDYNIPESGNGIPDLLDEAKWELDWLIKMQLENGSVLTKVSVTQFQASSPPSDDKAPRYYGPAQSCATRVVCSVFAHAYLVFKTWDSDYADELLQRAILAWEWLEANPGYDEYNNSGFGSANPIRSAYEQLVTQVGAAVFLFEATGEEKYQTFFDTNYTSFNSLEWGYWFPFQATFQDMLLYYTTLPEATESVKDQILNNYTQSVLVNNSEMYKAVVDQTDAYKAYLKDNDYVWGSNSVKCRAAMIMYNITKYTDAGDLEQALKQVALDYMHNMHGRNATGLTYLTNMRHAGASRSINEIYHNWFTDGSEYDNAQTSAKGPAPGFLSGGPNMHFVPDAQYNGPPLIPPLQQPVQKAYRDWNTSWPENSWEITENAIYYQTAYIRLISKFATGNYLDIEIEEPVITSFTDQINYKKLNLYPNPAGNFIYVEHDERVLAETVRIFDMQGRMVSPKFVKEDNSRFSIWLATLSPGLYIFELPGYKPQKIMVEK